jgi:hypothetical protein
VRDEEEGEVDPWAPLGSIPLDDSALQSDWKACDGYIAYSAELLRISLLAISGLAALCLKVHEKGTNTETIPVSVFRNSFVALAIAAGLSLVHRYLANDAMAFHIEALRRRKRNRPARTENEKEIKSDAVLAKRQESFRNRLFRASNWALIGAALCLILGVVLAGSSMRFVVTVSTAK